MTNFTSSHALFKVFTDHGMDRLFLVPGESYLGLLDALVDFPAIDVVTCRHEGGAGYMAVADGRLTRRPGLALVSRGPGASNAAIAVHTAQQDAVPMILVIGQIAARDLRREAFQEMCFANARQYFLLQELHRFSLHQKHSFVCREFLLGFVRRCLKQGS